jgi:2-methylaconitate isomerase
MTQAWIKAAFYRGGTSKGVFFHARDLPADRDACSQIFLSVIGSPDGYGRQLNGMGGGVSSLSKAVIIGPPSHPDADVDYTFIQLAVDKPVADWTNNCGNLSSAVGPFAVDEGLVKVGDGEARIRIHQTNTRKIIHARFPVIGGRAAVDGDFEIAGVSGTAARVRLDVLDPAGAVTGKLLPTGNVVDRIGDIDVSIIDATSPIVYVAAASLGLTGTETPDAIDANAGAMARLEHLRRTAGVMMGLAATPDKVGLQTPRIAIVSAPLAFQSLDGTRYDAGAYDVATRMISMERAHKAIPGTGGLNLGVAARITGTLPNRVARPANTAYEIRVGNPSGLVSVGAEVTETGNGWHAESAVLFRTARRLMQGEVAVPRRLVRAE